MKYLILLVLLFSSCATSQFLFECVKDNGIYIHKDYVTASSLDDAVQFYKKREQDFYCHRATFDQAK